MNKLVKRSQKQSRDFKYAWCKHYEDRRTLTKDKKVICKM